MSAWHDSVIQAPVPVVAMHGIIYKSVRPFKLANCPLLTSSLEMSQQRTAAEWKRDDFISERTANSMKQGRNNHIWKWEYFHRFSFPFSLAKIGILHDGLGLIMTGHGSHLHSFQANEAWFLFPTQRARPIYFLSAKGTLLYFAPTFFLNLSY